MRAIENLRWIPSTRMSSPSKPLIPVSKPLQLPLLSNPYSRYTLYSFIISSQAHGRPRVDFEQFKDTLYRLYITKRRPLDKVRQFIEDSHGFKAR